MMPDRTERKHQGSLSEVVVHCVFIPQPTVSRRVFLCGVADIYDCSCVRLSPVVRSCPQELLIGGKKVAGIDVSLKQKKAWEVAQAPAKQVGMMAFMVRRRITHTDTRTGRGFGAGGINTRIQQSQVRTRTHLVLFFLSADDMDSVARSIAVCLHNVRCG